ncbi:hypothetical protein CGRA01v4_10033 [Colletotrichum graminicola]|nr:hypothetical protein CGRA01v4_10033 [Colletotrichum graminicola]
MPTYLPRRYLSSQVSTYLRIRTEYGYGAKGV